MKMQNKQSVAVIGAGVVGICSAIELQQAGFHVTLFDKGDLARQTSYGNAAYIAAEYSEPLATPESITSAILHTFSYKSAFKVTPDHLLKFIPWGLRFINSARKAQIESSRAAIYDLNSQCVGGWERILKLTGNSQMLQRSGYLKLWESSSDLLKAQQMAEIMEKNDHGSKLLQGEALFEEEPALTRNINHALYFSNGHQLTDTYEVCLKLFYFFQKQGGEFCKFEVKRIFASEASVKLQTENGEYEFDKAIISAGIWSKQLVKDLGINVPLAAERGYHLTLPENRLRPRHIIESMDRHVVLSSLQSGLRIAGFGEYANLNSRPIEKRYQQLKCHLTAIIKDTEFDNQPVKTWMGIRPTLPDSLPVIDLHPQYSQIGMVFGHHHLGVTQAAISARLITALLSGGQAEKASAYSVSRF